MTTAPQIFDKILLRKRRDRAAPHFEAHDFLHKRAVEEIVDRLETVTRSFPKAAAFGAGTGQLRPILSENCGVGDLIQAEASPAMAAHLSGVRIIADLEGIPFQDEYLDLAISLLDLHAANDAPGALVQLKRTLKPDGLLLAAFLGGDTLTELRQAFAAAETEILGGVSPRISPMIDVRAAGGLLQRAGFALPVIDRDPLSVRYESPLRLMQDLRGMAETNILHERLKGGLRRDVLMRACEVYAEQFSDEEGYVTATFEMIYLTAWRPAPSQPQPLKPGSAEVSLTEVLKSSDDETG